MPKPKSEEDKKHGDKLESLISRTGGAASRDESNESNESDESDESNESDELQDDDDEDVQNDDPESGRDVGKRR